jgi:cytochrome c-type biogenesis protein CcmF
VYLLGTSLIVLAIASAVASAVCYAFVVQGRTALLRWGRLGVWGALLSAGAAAVLLFVLFLLQRYDIRYVYDYSSTDLELRFRLAAVWAGQSGSLVVWALVGLICAPFLIRRTRHFEPYVLAILMLLQAFLLTFMLIRNPFVPTLIDGIASNPPDGRGLNPQLHNVWMVIHPPTLFTGYGLLGVLFAMALAGWWRRDYDNWVPMALPWAIAGWTVLGLALAMGGYWAYETLGWGGYWAWDPVENSSLVPWLTGTALMHGLVLQRMHGGLRRANFFLAILTYGAVFYASFLTRSGVLSNFSVHSFVEEGLKYVMLATLLTLVGLGLFLLLQRWRDVPRKPLSEAVLSRDTMFALMMLTFVSIGAVVAFGTSMPWITSVEGLSYRLERLFGAAFQIDDGSYLGGQPLGDGRFSLMPDFFKRTTTPLGLILGVLMAFGPLLGWRGTDVRQLLFSLRWPFVAAVSLTSIGIVLGVREGMSLAYLLIATFALGTNLLMIVRTLRRRVPSGRGPRCVASGGYLAHIGVALLLVGIIGSYAYASPEEKLVIPQGETQSVLGHSFTFWGYEERSDGKHVLRLEVDRRTDGPFVALPAVYYNARMGTWVRTPAIKRALWQDLYIAPEEYLPSYDPNTADIGPGQQAEIGPYRLRFDKFEVKDHLSTDAYALVGATVTIIYENTVQVLTPQIRLAPNQALTSIPVMLPGGKELVLENFNVGAQLVRLRINGLNLPSTPARAVFTVSTKPAIALVWIGALLIATGGGLAVVRRQWEMVGAHEPVRSRLRAWGSRMPGLRGT